MHMSGVDEKINAKFLFGDFLPIFIITRFTITKKYIFTMKEDKRNVTSNKFKILKW